MNTYAVNFKEFNEPRSLFDALRARDQGGDKTIEELFAGTGWEGCVAEIIDEEDDPGLLIWVPAIGMKDINV